MPRTGRPAWKISGSYLGASGSLTELGPPDMIIALKRILSLCMRKPTTCIGENKDADQLRGNCEADQRFCFLTSESTISLLFQS